MNLSKIFSAIIVTVLIVPAYCQDGMDRAGITGEMYSKLRINASGPTTGRWERALGVYQTELNPRSSLEINTRFAWTPAPLPGIAGELFRTACPETSDSYWRMERGVTEYGLFSNTPSVTGFQNDFNIQSTNGSLRLFTNQIGVGARQRVHIVGNTNPIRDGWVGIGTTDPQGLLHLHQDPLAPAPAFLQTIFRMSNGNSIGLSGGMEMTLSPNQLFRFNLREDQDMIFQTHGNERMRIFGNTYDPGAGVTGIDDGVRIGSNPGVTPVTSSINGIGAVLGRPRLLVVGSENAVSYTPNYIVAEFRNFNFWKRK